MKTRHLLLVLLLGISSNAILAQSIAEDTLAHEATRTEVKVFEGDNGWGYDIYVNDKKYIHQTTIPSVPGTLGFKTEEDAKKVGDFTANKIKRNIMPPSVTPEELDSLGIVNLKE